MAHDAIESWFAAVPAEQSTVISALRKLIQSTGKSLVEEIKWSRPCYSNDNGMVCYLQTTKKHVTLGFRNGTSLDDPKKLLEGTGKDMLHIKIRSLEDIDKPAFKALIKQAITL